MASFGSLSDDAVTRRVCRAAFLARIERLAPRVLRSLHDDVLPVFEKAFAETSSEEQAPAATDVGTSVAREHDPAWILWSFEAGREGASRWDTELPGQRESVGELARAIEEWAAAHNLAWRDEGKLVNAWLLDVALRTLVAWSRVLREQHRRVQQCEKALEVAPDEAVREARATELNEARSHGTGVLGRFQKSSTSSAFRARFMDPLELEQAIAAAKRAEEREARAADMLEDGRSAEALREKLAAVEELTSIFVVRNDENPGDLPAFTFPPPFLVTETKEEWKAELESRLKDYLMLIERLTKLHFLRGRTDDLSIPRARTRGGDPFLHFDWLVRWQVLEETYDSIAEDPLGDGSKTRAPASVQDAVRGKSTLIGLTRRSRW